MVVPGCEWELAPSARAFQCFAAPQSSSGGSWKAARRVRLAGLKGHLTPNGFKLLAFLVRHAGKVAACRQLLKEVWGSARDGQFHHLRICVHQLRRKIEPGPAARSPHGDRHRLPA